MSTVYCLPWTIWCHFPFNSFVIFFFDSIEFLLGEWKYSAMQCPHAAWTGAKYFSAEKENDGTCTALWRLTLHGNYLLQPYRWLEVNALLILTLSTQNHDTPHTWHQFIDLFMRVYAQAGLSNRHKRHFFSSYIHKSVLLTQLVRLFPCLGFAPKTRLNFILCQFLQKGA